MPAAGWSPIRWRRRRGGRSSAWARSGRACGPAGSDREPAGHHVRLTLGADPEPERAVRLGFNGEAAHLIDRGGAGMACLRLHLDRSALRRDQLTKEGIVGDLYFDREARRL